MAPSIFDRHMKEIEESSEPESIFSNNYGFRGTNYLKCVLIGQIQEQKNAKDAVSDLQKNISEIRNQMTSSGSGIIVPETFVRQQNPEQDANGTWIGKNYFVYVYPLYDCDLYKLHQSHFSDFSDEIMINVLKQCLTRKRSNRRTSHIHN